MTLPNLLIIFQSFLACRWNHNKRMNQRNTRMLTKTLFWEALSRIFPFHRKSSMVRSQEPNTLIKDDSWLCQRFSTQAKIPLKFWTVKSLLYSLVHLVREFTPRFSQTPFKNNVPCKENELTFFEVICLNFVQFQPFWYTYLFLSL